MSQPTYGIAITADDRTAKGIASAEGRLGKLSGRAGRVNERAMAASERSIGRSGRAIVRTFGDAEKAGAKIFGGRSVMAGVSARMGAVGEAASAMGTGMGAAAAEGGILTGVLGGVGAAVAGIVGVVAAAGIGLMKLADGWSRSSASIGRTAEIIGVGTKAMQEFSAAAERMGVDRDKATGALGGLSQTLNDARYGRNNQALAVLSRLGVQMQTNADGTVNVEAMLPAIADALARQNSSGRRTAARNLGISLDVLPAFTQGGKALSADMADSDKTATVLTDGQIEKAKRQARKSVMRDQLLDRGVNRAKELASDASEYANDGLVAGGRWIAGADTIDRAGGKMDRAGGKMERAADKLSDASYRIGGAGGVASGAGRYSAGQIKSLAQKAAPLAVEATRYGFTPAEAVGVAANVVLESGGDERSKERGGSGRGLIQWTDSARKKLFREKMGVDVENSTREQQWRFLRWETQNSERKGWTKALANGQNPASIAAGFARYVERPANKDRDSAERAAVAAATPIPVKVEIDMRGAPPGTRTKVTAGGGRAPAKSMAYEPVRGG